MLAVSGLKFCVKLRWMARFSTSYVCQQCGYQSPSFLGKCPECGSWNSLVETTMGPGRGETKTKKVGGAKPIRLSEVKAEATKRVATGIGELDRVLGGGIVPGMVVLIAGEPGIGKSTLLLQLVESLSKDESKEMILYVAGEESASQIKIRASRLGVKADNLLVLEETDVDGVVAGLESVKPALVIVDSIQTLTTADLSGTAGSVGQVRECAARLIAAAKPIGLPLFIVGHVTKEGAIAGPKVLEHAVDTVLNLEGDRYGGLRLVRAVKNRFGPTDEVGVFEMKDAGLVGVTDLNLLTDFTSSEDKIGSCLTVTLEGTRPIVVEIQALTTSTPLPAPRRVANGIDYSRLLMLVAVLQKRLNLPLYKEDIYVNVSGGINVAEPAVDLAVGLAVLSSYRGKALPAKTVAVGELDLLGNVRRVNSLDKRVKEAKKLGFKNIMTPENLKTISNFKF